MMCSVCHYPSESELCQNPACLVDKGDEQRALIEQAQEARRKHEAYLAQHRGINYGRSLKQ